LQEKNRPLNLEAPADAESAGAGQKLLHCWQACLILFVYFQAVPSCVRPMTCRFFLGFSLLLACLFASPVGAQQSRSDTVERSASSPQDFSRASSAIEKGFAALERGDLDSAESLFKQALAADATNPRAYNGLGLVYYKRGRSRFYPLEALKKLLKADNSSKAIKNFKKALKLDPEFDEARYNLGLAELARNKKDGFRKARVEFAHLAEKDSTYKDVVYRMGQSEFGLGNYEAAGIHYQRALRIHPGDRRAEVRLAEVYLEAGDLAKASKTYFDGIARLRDPDMLQELYSEIEDLLTPQEVREYASLPIEKKGMFFRRFWSKRDPTPGTIENERFAEHFRRVQYAKTNFGIPFPPYFDDRGKIYIKYGPPDAVYRGVMYTGNVRSNESWSYESIHKGLIFDFVDYGGLYREVADLTAAAPPGAGFTREMALAQQLYAERTELGGTYAAVGSNFDSSRLMELANAKARAMREAPAEVYRHNYHAKPLPVYFDIAQFRGRSGRTRAEIYYGLRGRDLKFVDEGRAMTSTLDYNFVVKDTNYELVAQKDWTSAIRIPKERNVRTQMPINQGVFEANPGTYLLALQVGNPEGKALGIYKLPIRLRRFSADSLQLSDVQLSYNIVPESRRHRFVKNRLSVVPYPFDRVDRGRPIFIYFEAYNLARDLAGQTDYVVEYQVEVVNPKRSFFSKTFGALGRIFAKSQRKAVKTRVERKGNTTTAIEYISLDLSRLPAGITRLSVIVRDLNAGTSAVASRTFQLTG